MAEWRKICCAVDFSESSGLAVNEAADLAKRFQAELTVLHVYEAPAAAAAALEVPLLEHVQRAAGEAERKLAECRSSVEQKVSRAVLSAMPQGGAAAEILRFAREGSFDLLVVGTHGRKGIQHLMLGSVAERVVREADCPVLVVRGRRTS
jgi:nucleotide-binding universal stress UspA family protein